MRESTKRFWRMLKGRVLGNTVIGTIEGFREGYNPSSHDSLRVKLENGEVLEVHCEGNEYGDEIHLCKERLIQPLSMMHGRSLKWKTIKKNQPVKIKIYNDFDWDYVTTGWFLTFYVARIRNVKKAS